MQKLSSYLYPNRIQVYTNLDNHTTEQRIVYQRRIKIYKGLTNNIEFDFKNSEQKSVSITGFTIKCVVMDVNGREVYTGDVIPLEKQGLAVMKIHADVFSGLDQQYLNYSLYLINNQGEKLPVYADTQFGAVGTMELISNAMPVPTKPETIKTFIKEIVDTRPGTELINYYSSSLFVRPRNDLGDSETITLDFVFNDMEGEVTVQITDSYVINQGNIWRDLESFQISPSTKFLTKSYYEVKDFDDNICWLRVKYTKTVGSIQKVIVRFNEVPYVNLIDGDDADQDFNENSLQLDGGFAPDNHTNNNTTFNGGEA
jgi:hypothetical protein